MDVLITVLTILLSIGGVVGLIALMVCWMVYDTPANFPALLREACRPRLSYKSRVSITGGFYAGYTGTLLERDDATYCVNIDSGIGDRHIAIRHVRPLLPLALPSPHEQDEVVSLYPEIGDE